MRLIDADALIALIEKRLINTAIIGWLRRIISEVPTIEVEPVRHGRWIWKGDDKGWFCSECGGGCLLDTESDWFKSNGCPHCRAKMAGDET